MEGKYLNEEEAHKALRANISTRYEMLESYEKWGKGTQYEGMQDFWDDSNDRPLWERAPCIVYPVVRLAASSNVDLTMGSGRFPAFTTGQSEDESDDEDGLSSEESDVLDRFIRNHHKRSRFRSHSRAVFYSAQVAGTAVAIHGVRNGRPFAEEVPAKWCTPKFGDDGEVIHLEIKYPYLEEYKTEQGKKALRAKLYRRVINDKDDIEYHPAEANKLGIDPSWVKNPARSVSHNLGFCPVIWYPLTKGCSTVNEIDGKPIHDKLTNEIRQHDIARSQWHRGALFSEPQIVETGVAPGYNPTELGRVAIIQSTERGGPVTPENPITGAFHEGRKAAPARKKGPGWVWQYTSKDAEVDVLVYPAEALKAQQDNASDLRIKLQEALAVVFLDPENIKFAATTSGKALRQIKQKQLDRCDQFRDDMEDGFFEPSIAMQLRIAHVVLKRNQKLRVPGAQSVLPVLEKLALGDDGWTVPWIQTKWGPYFELDAAERKAIIEMVQQALGGSGKVPVITLRLALENLKGVLGINNIKALLDELVKKQEEREKLAAEIAGSDDGSGDTESFDGKDKSKPEDDESDDKETEAA